MKPEDKTLPEEEVFLVANTKYEKAKKAVDNFSKRPKKTRIERPDLTISEADLGSAGGDWEEVIH